MRSTGDPTLDLIASVYRQALVDAHSGDLSAVAWLDVCCPDWRERESVKPHRQKHRSPRSLQFVKRAKERTLIKESGATMPQ